MLAFLAQEKLCFSLSRNQRFRAFEVSKLKGFETFRITQR